MVLVSNWTEGYSTGPETILFGDPQNCLFEKIDQLLQCLWFFFFLAGNAQRTFWFTAIVVGPIVLPQATDHIGT